jgi:hypothetical protein
LRHLLLLHQVHWWTTHRLLRLRYEAWVLGGWWFFYPVTTLVQVRQLTLILIGKPKIHHWLGLILYSYLLARTDRLRILTATLAFHLCITLLLLLHVICYFMLF